MVLTVFRSPLTGESDRHNKACHTAWMNMNLLSGRLFSILIGLYWDDSHGSPGYIKAHDDHHWKGTCCPLRGFRISQTDRKKHTLRKKNVHKRGKSGLKTKWKTKKKKWKIYQKWAQQTMWNSLLLFFIKHFLLWITEAYSNVLWIYKTVSFSAVSRFIMWN